MGKRRERDSRASYSMTHFQDRLSDRPINPEYIDCVFEKFGNS